MKRTSIAMAVTALAGVAGSLVSNTATAQVSVPAGVIPPHLSTEASRYYTAHPDAWSAPPQAPAMAPLRHTSSK